MRNSLLLYVIAILATVTYSTGTGSDYECPAGLYKPNSKAAPRIFLGKQPSANLADYTFLNCESEGTDTECKIAIDFDELKEETRTAILEGKEDSLLQYALGLSFYSVMNGIFASAIILGTVLTIIFRYFWCCGGVGRCSRHQCCGGKAPTDAGCCRSGFVLDADNNRFAYPLRSRICVRLMLITYILAAVALLIVGHVQGTQALTTGIENFLIGNTAPFAVLSGTLRQAVTPVISFSAELFENVVTPLVVDINATLFEAVSLVDTYENMVCVQGHVHDLPDIDAIISSINTVQGGVSSIESGIDGISNEITDVETLLNSLSTDASTLKSGLANIDNDIDELASALETTSTAVTSASTATDTIALTGATIRANFNSFITNANVIAVEVEGVMDSTVTSGSRPTLNGFIAGTQNQNDFITLLSKISDLSTSAAAGTFLAASSDNTAYNTLINNLVGDNGPIHNMVTEIEDVNTLIAALPSTATSLETQIDNLLGAARTLSLSDVIAAINSLGSTIDSFPGLAELLEELNAAKSLADLVPCIVAVRDNILAADSIVSLPEAVTDILDDLLNVESLVDDALAEIDPAILAVNDANNTLKSIDISGYISDAAAAEASIESAVDSLDSIDVDALLAPLDGIENRIPSTLVTDLNTARTNLPNAAIPTNALNAYNSFVTAYNTDNTGALPVLQSLSASLLDELTIFAQGTCLDGSQCSTSSPCGTATCDNMRPRCVSSLVPGVRSSSETSCTQDSDCANYCAGGSTRINAGLLAQLESYITVVDGIEPTWSSAVVSTPFQTLASSLSDSQTTFTELHTELEGIDLSNFDIEIQALIDEIDNAGLDDVKQALADSKNDVIALDLQQYISALEDSKEEIEQVEADYLENVDELVTFLLFLLNFTRTTLRTSVIPNFQAEAIVSSYNDGGLYTYAKNLGGTFQFAVTTFIDGVPGLDMTPYALIDRIEDNRNTLNRSNALLAPSTYRLDDNYYGSVSLNIEEPILPLSNLLNHSIFFDPADYTGLFVSGSLFQDAQGRDYDEVFKIPAVKVRTDELDQFSTLRINLDQKDIQWKQMCTSKQCLLATTKIASTEPISKLTSTADLGDIPVALTRETVMLVLWVVPGISVLFALWALLAPHCCICRHPSWKKVPASWLAGILICELPILLLITAVAFPASLAMGDVCDDMPSIAMSIIRGSDNNTVLDLCSTLNGVGSNSDCLIDYDLVLPDEVGGATNLTLSLDLSALMSSVFEGCTTNSSDDAFTQLSVQIDSKVDLLFNDLFDNVLSYTSEEGFTFKGDLRSDVEKAFDNSVPVVKRVIRSTLQGALGCENLNAVFESARSSLCCGLVGPIYWYISAWYLLCWAMLLCGLPGACLGRKRLPAEPWGPIYEARNVDIGLVSHDIALSMEKVGSGTSISRNQVAEGSEYSNPLGTDSHGNPRKSPNSNYSAQRANQSIAVGRPSQGYNMRNQGKYDSSEFDKRSKF